MDLSELLMTASGPVASMYWAGVSSMQWAWYEECVYIYQLSLCACVCVYVCVCMCGMSELDTPITAILCQGPPLSPSSRLSPAGFPHAMSSPSLPPSLPSRFPSRNHVGFKT